MRKATHVNDFISSLPKIRMRKIWNIIIDGKAVSAVKAYTRDDAEKFASSQYPNVQFKLKYMHKCV